ncbi:MAG: LD-carboxypeptidase [Bacteroidales bacterium]|nr:LD-carboxypeptidase [Bacteroidales bacterium]
MIIPPFLKEGDTIGIIAPARRMDEQDLIPAFDLLRNEGFNVFYDERLFAKEHRFAGSDDLRAEYIQSILDHPDIQAIWCVRGGYGSVRIIDKLDFSGLCKHPKWLCGYSDVTVFHEHIHTCCDMATLHCEMPYHINDSHLRNEAVVTMLDALRGKELRYEFPTHPLNRPGDFSAPVVGGNISILYSINGSRSDLDTAGKILFIEDLDEYLYHIDRMMYCLKRSGKLKNLSGLLVGHLNDMRDNPVPFGHTAEEIIAECCAEYDFPIIFNFPAGHLPDNRAIRMGCPMTVSCTAESVITTQKALCDNLI